MSDQLDYNRKLIEDFRASRENDDVVLNGRPLLLLTTIGVKSGERRTSPMMNFPDGDRFIVIASNAGAPTDPHWYRNLVAHPEVTVEVGKETFEATAKAAEGDERAHLWAKAIESAAPFAEYQAKVARQIPVVILERRKV